MIAGVLIPDEGGVKVRGGVAPLIELTGGFVGDLTARDNIYLDRGPARAEQGADGRALRRDRRLRRASATCLDMAYRHFSSGMQVRLAFALITTLDEPIVLVDEVLAVGDRAFREKCYARMENMLAGGKTLFLVSHSEADLRRFSTRGLYLRRASSSGTVRSRT